MLDLATRAHNHSYRIDPIVRSLLDTDFYKFLMLQFIWLHYRTVPVTFSLMVRVSSRPSMWKYALRRPMTGR